MSKKIKDEQKKFLGETLNQYDKALDEAINQLDKKNREQNHKISSLTNSFDNEYLEKDVEGNMTALENSKNGMVIINEIQGSTEVNYCKDGEKELILNGDIDTQGKSFVTITEGVDGGLVDVSLEGNTEINLSKTKDPVLVTREFDDINCNVGKLQYTIDDVTTINDEPGKVDIDRIVGDTMVNHAVNGSEELILNAHINESGDNSITLNGVTSDGGKVDVALEGNTLVNVSKTKDSTAITKSYTVENSGNHIALQGDVDGSCRPVITGNTLVNLWTEDCSKTYCTLSDNTIVFTLPETEGYPSCISKLRYNLKPGGTYTVILSVISLPSGTDLKVGGDSPNELPYFSTNITQTGLYKKAITIPSDKTDNTRLPIWSYTDGSIEDDIVITKPILLEGDYTNKPIPDYFTGLQSSFEDNLVTQEMVDSGEEEVSNLGKYRVEYKVTGKNKLSTTTAIKIEGYLTSTDSSQCIYKKWSGADAVSYIIPCLPNTTYTVSSTGNRYAMAEFNHYPNDGDISKIAQRTITTSSSAKWLVLYVNSSWTDDNLYVQLEEGNTSTSYEPYKEYTKTLYLNSPLLEGDTIEEQNGSVYHVHRYEEVVLDGNEKWSTMSNWSNYFPDTLGYTRFQLSQSDLYFNLEDRPITIISDKFPSISNINWKTLSEHIENDEKKINIVTSKATTVDEFKSWLQQNPVTAVYKLAEPQYELIEQSNLVIPSYANGHLDLTSAVPVEKVEFKPFSEEMTYLYPATSYTIQFISDKAVTIDITLGGTSLLSQNIVKGLNRISITTPATLVDNKLIIDGVGAKISDVVVTDTNREFKYFEGMKSVGENGLKIYSGKPQRFGKGGKI